ncbi:MAG: rhodanese-like domain-containing protein [Schleiferiaceae bacterium]|nr:rhodanese-like domain-containing protein [Schleiferiaceae bacterium]
MFGFFKNLFKSSFESLNGAAFKAKFQEAKKSGVLLDVRTPYEFKSGHIKGAINVDMQSPNFAQQAQKLSKDKMLFVYCRSGARSYRACSSLSKAGFTVYNLSGGIGAWPK